MPYQINSRNHQKGRSAIRVRIAAAEEEKERENEEMEVLLVKPRQSVLVPEKEKMLEGFRRHL